MLEHIIGEAFGEAFGDALGMIFATEIGDKTFFIAAILAMQQPRLIVFTGAISALIVMTIISTIFGHLVPQLLPPILTHWASILLFLYFGGRMLYSASEMYRNGEGIGVSEELEEVEHELREKGLAHGDDEEAAGENHEDETELIGRPADFDDHEAGAKGEAVANGVRGEGEAPRKAAAKKSKAVTCEPPSKRQVLIQAFTLTFLAEWGDRSQIATIVLAASQDAVGVTLGACFGHSICTGMAVIGGRLLASRISERQVSLGGGILFILFAVVTIYLGPPTHHEALLKSPLAGAAPTDAPLP